MKGILLASHGRLAEGLLDTLQIFCGELQQMQALCLLPGEEITEFMEKLEAAIQKVDTGEGVVIFCDLLFGSPCNCSSGAAGMDREALVDTGHKGIVDFNKLLRERQAA